jgi:hypothetical protein
MIFWDEEILDAFLRGKMLAAAARILSARRGYLTE